MKTGARVRGLFAQRQDVDRVLDGDRTESLESASDLHAEVAGLGRDLMDQEEPTRVCCVRHEAIVAQLSADCESVELCHERAASPPERRLPPEHV